MFKVTRIFFWLVLFAPFCVYGEEVKYGIGAASGGGINLYVPITRGELFVEPTLNFFKSKNSAHYSDGVSSGNYSNDYRSMGLGIGIFRRSKVAEHIYLYGGGRVGFFQTRSNYNDSVGYEGNAKGHGYSVAPSIGVEHDFFDNFSVGLEFSYGYSKQKIVFSQASFSRTDEVKSYSTGTNVMVRYRFY